MAEQKIHRVCGTGHFGVYTYEYVLDRDSVSIFSELSDRDVFLVNFEL